MFHFLPKDILQHIYEYDNTYHTILNNCLQDIQYRLYIESSIYYKRIHMNNNSYNTNNNTTKYSVEIFSFQKIKKQQQYTTLERKEKIQDYLFNKILINSFMNDVTYLSFNGFYCWWNKMRKCIKPIDRDVYFESPISNNPI